MRVMLLCSSFNGLTQRVWLDLRAAGYDVRVELSSDMDSVRAAALDIRSGPYRLPVPSRAGSGRSLDALSDDHHSSRSDRRSGGLFPGLGDHR